MKSLRPNLLQNGTETYRDCRWIWEGSGQSYWNPGDSHLPRSKEYQRCGGGSEGNQVRKWRNNLLQIIL